MARKTGTQVDNKFIKGLITETTALNFPEDACTSADNCIFDETGRVTRRLGIDYENNHSAVNADFESTDVWTEYIWETARGDSRQSFVVQQHGSTIKIYNISSSLDIGANYNPTSSFSLLSFVPDIVLFQPSEHECQYAQGNNQLIIVNKGCDPILCTYNDSSGLIETSKIKLKFRDFEGISDGLTLNERPTSTVANLRTNNPEHYYNLLNQGWYQGATAGTGSNNGRLLADWDTARTDLPSNADAVAYYVGTTGSLDNTLIDNKTVGNTPAPKGHFILEVGNINRTQAMVTEGFTGAAISSESVLIGAGVGSVIGNATSNQANAFDSNTAQNAANSASKSVTTSTSSTWLYLGKDYTAATPRKIGYAKIYPSTDQGFVLTATRITARLYGKNGSSPTSPTDGTQLGQLVAFSDITTGSYSIASTDITTSWDYVWVTLFHNSTTQTMYVSEVEFYSPHSGISYHRPQTNAFYAGRAWYSGLEDGDLSNDIFFSRIILEDADYGKCYQANDPTSVHNADLLPDDGGVIRLLEASRIVKLFPFQNSLLVFATNGVWRITGGQGQGQGFQANDFSIRKISAVGVDSAMSTVDVRGAPVWWSEDGIYTIQYEQNFDGLSTVSLTEKSIKSYILAIPRPNRKFVKGAYDVSSDTVYWLFNSTSSNPTADRYKYNKILCYNLRSQAFYPWTVTGTPKIRGVLYTQDAQRELTAKVKYVTTTDISSTNTNIRFSEFWDTDYKDWDTNNDDVLYESTFTTGYKLHGETQRFIQANYVFVFLDHDATAGCFIQGVFDFTNSASSGKWSTSQQVYKSGLTYRDINFRRLKIRGKGRSLQLKFTSDSTKPFSIIGWSLRETQNAEI